MMQDPLNNVIRQWKGVSGGDSGVVELSMPTSDRLVLGEWTIEAKVLVSFTFFKERLYCRFL